MHSMHSTIVGFGMLNLIQPFESDQQTSRRAAGFPWPLPAQDDSAQIIRHVVQTSSRVMSVRVYIIYLLFFHWFVALVKYEDSLAFSSINSSGTDLNFCRSLCSQILSAPVVPWT